MCPKVLASVAVLPSVVEIERLDTPHTTPKRFRLALVDAVGLIRSMPDLAFLGVSKVGAAAVAEFSSERLFVTLTTVDVAVSRD